MCVDRNVAHTCFQSIGTRVRKMYLKRRNVGRVNLHVMENTYSCTRAYLCYTTTRGYFRNI